MGDTIKGWPEGTRMDSGDHLFTCIIHPTYRMLLRPLLLNIILLKVYSPLTF